MRKQGSEFSFPKNCGDSSVTDHTGELQSQTYLSEDNYRDLVECSGSIIMKTDRNLNITYMNDFGLKFFGYSMKELLGKNVVGTTIPRRDDSGRDLEAMAEEIKKEPAAFGTNVHQNMRKNGELVWVSWTNRPKFDEEGNLTEILAIGNDISKLIKADENLRESEERFRAINETSPIGVGVCSAGGVIVYTNPAFERILGNSPGEIIGMKITDVYWDPEESMSWLGLNENGVVRDYEVRLGKKDGSPVWTSVNTSPVAFGGKPAVMVTVQDITSRKQLQDELTTHSETLEERVRLQTEEVIAERKRLFDVLETLPAMICLLTEDYHVDFANRSFRDKFGESNGRHCYEYCFDKEEPCEFCETYTVLKSGAPHHWEVELLDGTIIDVNDFPFTNDEGSPLILEMNVDITKQRRFETELIKSRENLQKVNENLMRSNRELEDFAYVASHDLQEPLRTVTSFAQLLVMKYGEKFDDDAKEYLEFIVNGGKRMYELINGLLAYSRISRKEVVFSLIDLNKIIDIVKANLVHFINKRNCKIECTRLPRVSADPNQMIQLFQNLISNSIKFSKDSPCIYVSCKTEKTRYVISVRDEGIGIESRYFDKIFHIFKRLMPRDEYEGTGIGLAICKRIVENHKGEIWVESEPGKGSVFYFTLARNSKPQAH